jgi:hypothetical protein
VAKDRKHLACPFCGQESGHLFHIKVFCMNENCAIFDLPIDAEKWDTRNRLDDVESARIPDQKLPSHTNDGRRTLIPGTWQLKCQECGHVFPVKLRTGGNILKAAKTRKCPKCRRAPVFHPGTSHHIQDYFLPKVAEPKKRS